MAEYLIQGETLESMADKIRILNGVEGGMTTAQMDSNLDVANTNIENAFTAVGNKGGTIPQSKISGNLANAINSIPEGAELPALTNEGSAADLLSGKQLINQEGNIVTGIIATKTSSNLTANGATVTVPAGYYASQATKSVSTATRADTTISVTADDTNDKLTITASNNQGTGYVTGANKTASKTISLTANGATVTASDGTNSISKSVATATQATPSISVNSSGLITASATQSAGYVSAGTKSGTKQLTTQGAQTITPSTTDKTIASGRYLTGTQTIKGDANLIPANIVSGKSIFGVSGSAQTGGVSNLQELWITPSDYEQCFIPSDFDCDGFSSVTVEGDENLIPENIVSGVSIFGVDGIAEGGSGDNSGSIVDGSITKYSDSSIDTIREYAFYNCHSLHTIDVPNVHSVNQGAFYNCKSLKKVVLPSVYGISREAFLSSGVVLIDLQSQYSSILNIESHAFKSTHFLKALILRNTTNLWTASSNPFYIDSVNPIGEHTYIYVPRAMLDSYKTATNWSLYSDRFRALEDYTVDGTVTGEFDITTDDIYIDLCDSYSLMDMSGNEDFSGVEIMIEDGMTWEEFIASSLNDGMFSLSPDGYIVYSDTYYVFNPEMWMPTTSEEPIMLFDEDYTLYVVPIELLEEM